MSDSLFCLLRVGARCLLHRRQLRPILPQFEKADSRPRLKAIWASFIKHSFKMPESDAPHIHTKLVESHGCFSKRRFNHEVGFHLDNDASSRNHLYSTSRSIFLLSWAQCLSGMKNHIVLMVWMPESNDPVSGHGMGKLCPGVSGNCSQ